MKTDDPFRAQFTVEKLGAIEHAELTIRPLTLFFGPNGTNKTWAAYALYGLLRRCRHSGFPDTRPGAIDPWVAALQPFVDRIEAAVDSAPQHPVRRRLSLDELREATAGGYRSRLDGAELNRLLALGPEHETAGRAELQVNAEVMDQSRRRVPNEATLTHWGDSLNLGVFYREDDGTTSDARGLSWPVGEQPQQQRRLVRALLSQSVGTLASEVLAFPAERKALLVLSRQLRALIYFGLLGNQSPADTLQGGLANNRIRDAKELEEILPQPTIDFLNYLDAISRSKTSRSESPLANLAARLDSLVGGRLDFVPNLMDGEARRLSLDVGTDSVPVQSTHSLMRSLGGLDLYLRYSATCGDFVFIDEPEMNAHPETQVAIAEFIALMVNAGLRVVATTHSPYIIDHLHNLIEAGRLAPDAQEKFAERFKLRTADAFIAADKVAAYHFDRGGVVTDAFDRDDRVIDWSILGDDADDIANLYSELLGAQLDE